MRENLRIIVIKDAKGQQCSAVCGGLDQTIQLVGLDAKNERQHFESEAYHCPAWASQHGFHYTLHTVTLNLERKSVEHWVSDDAKPGDVWLTHCPVCKSKLPWPAFRSAEYIQGMRDQGCFLCDHAGSGPQSLVGAEQV